jgi:hypothetical protein
MEITTKAKAKEIIEAGIARGGTLLPDEQSALDAWFAPIADIRLPDGWFVERLSINLVRFRYYQHGIILLEETKRLHLASGWAKRLNERHDFMKRIG